MQGFIANPGSLLVKQPLAAAFVPPQSASFKAWYDASDATTITLNGGNVSQWNDKSGNTNHAVQGTAINQPLYDLAAQNGKNAVLFNGTTNLLTAPKTASLDTIADTFTFFAVVKWSSFTNTPFMFTRGTAGNNVVGVGVTGPAGVIYGSTFVAGLRSGSVLPSVVTRSLETYYRSGTGTDHVRHNRALVDAAITGATIGADTGGLAIGAATVTNLMQGHICEMLFWGGVQLLAAEIDYVELYLNTKWATP